MEVVAGIAAQMIHRHPHVFKGEEAKTQEDLRRLWQQAKAREGKVAPGALGKVSPALPALVQAHRLGEAAAPPGLRLAPGTGGPGQGGGRMAGNPPGPQPALPTPPGRKSWGLSSFPW